MFYRWDVVVQEIKIKGPERQCPYWDQDSVVYTYGSAISAAERARNKRYCPGAQVTGPKDLP